MPRDRLSKLAEGIDALIEKDDSLLRRAREVEELRRDAAVELHNICAAFAGDLNRLLKKTQVVLDPPEYRRENFHGDGPNLFQLNVRGRILQFEFKATDETVSTEEFRIPYTIEGSVRSFNQMLLEQHMIREHWLFYCLEGNRRQWRYFDERTYRSGPLGTEYLAEAIEELLG